MKKNLTINETFELALKNQKENNLTDAQKLYHDTLSKDPSNVDAYNNLGIIYKTLGDHLKAIDFFKKALEINPTYVNAYINLASILYLQGKYSDAKNYYEKVIEINPNHLHANNNLGIIFYHYGMLKDAISYYKKTIEIDPNYEKAHNNLGTALHKFGDYEGAISSVEKALKINPNNKSAQYNMAFLLFEIGQFKKAAAYFVSMDFKKSKSYLLNCQFELDEKNNFYEELDRQIRIGEINAMIGSMCLRAEIKYGIVKKNPFCNDPLNYVINKDLKKIYDFENIFVKTAKQIFNDDTTLFRNQDLITNGVQTAGNLFLQKNNYIDKIKEIIHLEIENYKINYKNSEEGFLKKFPAEYTLNGWLIKMKNGGKIKAHIHENGWLSGSIYINVPPKIKTNSGNLVVSTESEKSMTGDPKNKKILDIFTGSICLFPASLLHYTIPFEAKEERIVLAFDVDPKI